MGIDVPEEFGGQGGTFFQSILAIEEIAKVDPAASVIIDVQNTLVNNAIARWASDEQKKRYLPLLAATVTGAYALSEAQSGSDAFALATRARATSNGYSISGRKLWITNAAEAGVFLVFATVDPSAGYKGITCFLIERDTPGFRIGKKEDKLGIRASSTCELIFDDCLVPRASVMGEPGKGYRVAIETLNEGRIGIGAQMVGLAQGPSITRSDYAKDRKQFGKTIGEFQGVQFELAEMAVGSKRRVCSFTTLPGSAMPGSRSSPRRQWRNIIGSVDRRRGGIEGGRDLRRSRVHPGLPRREAISRCEDRANLRGNQ